MITFDYFPGGKKVCITFSYDDGPKEDIRLIELFNKYNLKGTFNINDSFFKYSDASELKARYTGHEIACHGRYHMHLNNATPTTVINEVFEQRKTLERLLVEPICGMAYSYSLYDKNTMDTLRDCGFAYARTIGTGNMAIPEDFMEWAPTCHHTKGLETAQALFKRMEGYFAGPKILFIWGHAHELRTEEDWAMVEELCEYISNDERIWYATNIEICRYVEALKNLVISANENIIYNPSAMDVWVAKDRQPVKIGAGQTVKLG